jgi:A/G-specific adenine glycosylase
MDISSDEEANRPSAGSAAAQGHASRASIKDVRRRLLRWWPNNRRDYWWRQQYDPYTIALVEILLKQTRASTAAATIERFVGLYPDPTFLARASEGELARELHPLGFHRQRAAQLVQFAESLVREPQALEDSTAGLKKLPGIGTYAATAISVFAHGRRETVIDVNVVRVFSRVWGLSTERGELRKSRVIAEVARAFARTTRPREANWALLDLGAAVCTERKPRCGLCPLSDCCLHSKTWATRLQAL